MCVTDVPAKTVEINHYVKKIKEHDARRASWNERMAVSYTHLTLPTTD